MNVEVGQDCWGMRRCYGGGIYCGVMRDSFGGVNVAV